MADPEIPRIGFLGAGKMASALARGWLQAGLAAPERLFASDPVREARDCFRSETEASISADNIDVVATSDLLVLAVKPQNMAALIEEIGRSVLPRHVVISLAPGFSLAWLAERLGRDRIVRVVPNTPCLVGAGASAYSPAPQAAEADIALVDRLLNAVGRAFRLPEKLLDAAVGLSGSGPAFVYLTIEALADGGVRAGLSRDVASALAAQTVLGAAKMTLETKLHPGELKDMVASAGGTTIAGLHALERGGVRGAFMDAVVAAAARSAELGST